MAAGSISVKLEGQASLLSKLKGILPKVREGTRLAVAETALLVETDAKLFAPVDTGRLRSSIHAEIAPDGLRATVVAEANYAVHVEFGTRYQRAQPFLFPAYEKNRLAFVAALKRNTKLF